MDEQLKEIAEECKKDADHIVGKLTNDSFLASKGVNLGAAGLSLAIVFLLIQVELRSDTLTTVALYSAVLAIPIWLASWQIAESYALYGEESYRHMVEPASFWKNIVLQVVGAILLLVSFVTIIWSISIVLAVLFLALTFFMVGLVGRYSKSIREFVEASYITNEELRFKSLIRTIPNYPKPGIQFRDVTTLLKDPQGLAMVVDGLAEHYQNQKIDKIAGIEARGFIVGAALAYKLGVGFVPLRKAGKLPAETISQEYQLEYGTDQLEVHTDAIAQGEQVLLVDDLIATGGTAQAAIALIERLGGDVVGAGFIVDLPDLGGMRQLQTADYETFALCAFEGE